MKILFISRQFRYPPTFGGAQRSAIIHRALSTIADVDLVVLSGSAPPPDCDTDGTPMPTHTHITPEVIYDQYARLGEISPQAARIMHLHRPVSEFPASPNATSQIREIINKTHYDLIVCRYLTTLSLCGLTANDNVVVDIDDLPEQVFLTRKGGNQKSLLQKILFRYKHWRVAHYTRSLTKKCLHVWLPNPEHVRKFSNASWLPNIPYPFSKQNDINKEHAYANHKRVLFVGLMDWPPNQEAVAFFVNQVWKKVLAVIPDAELRIVGGKLPAEFKEEWERLPGVQAVGYVENLDLEYQASAIAVVPMFSGSGTNIKVLEAMDRGLPCLISKHAAKGFDDVIRHGETALLASTPDEFAHHTVTLLQDVATRRKIGEAGQVAVRKTYGFQTVLDEIKRTIIPLATARGSA